MSTEILTKDGKPEAITIDKTKIVAPGKTEVARPLPQPDADFYHLANLLSEDERKKLEEVRAFMRTKVAPIVNKNWAEASFPFEIIPGFRDLNIAGLGLNGYGSAGGSTLFTGFVTLEIAKVDSSIATFWGVHGGLAMGSIFYGGSEEQKQKWLPPMARMEKIGAFALTEPLVGSGTGGGLLTTARREGDTWILNGQKKWIGNATWSDLTIVWAKDVADGQVKGFIVENKKTPGFKTEKIENKIGLRIVQNALITMEDCRIPEENRLQNANSFRDTAKVLRFTRAGVAWEAVGNMMGAYENALVYAQQRKQFGKPIGSFQLIQDLLVKMLGNITACFSMVVQLSKLQDAGKARDEQSSLAKSYCTVKMRETVAYARELFGANGILLDYNVARFFNDSEALYSYEGTREMNTLIVGKAITGFSAFV
jgi:glutaryl-CoA dehydrogenase